MNKYQKLVQQQFLNDEETVIVRLEGIYDQSLKDITAKISVLDSLQWRLDVDFVNINPIVTTIKGKII